MAADGVADPEEMAVIRNVQSLDLDMDEIEAMRDKITLDLTAGLASGDNVEALVGIDESWSTEQKKHLRAEFKNGVTGRSLETQMKKHPPKACSTTSLR